MTAPTPIRPLAPLSNIAAETERHAYNAAFEELGLSWYWGAATYGRLMGRHRGREAVRAYLLSEQAHLLRAYEADFLVAAIETARSRYQAGFLALAHAMPHPARNHRAADRLAA